MNVHITPIPVSLRAESRYNVSHKTVLVSPKGEHVKSQNMGVMHHTITTINTNLCQNKMSTKTVSKQNIKSWKKNRINVTLKNEEFDHYLNKYVERKPAPPPKIKVSIKLDIRS